MACQYSYPKELSSPDGLKSKVYGAVARVVHDSPTLCTAIKDAESKKPVWMHIEGIDVGEYIEWIELDTLTSNSKAVQNKIHSELNKKFAGPGEKPGWRVVILNHAGSGVLDIVFTWNHAHTDGLGGKIFHDKLLESLSIRNQDLPMAQMDNVTKLYFHELPERFPPATELFVDLPMSINFLLQQAWKETKPTSLFPNQSAAIWAPTRMSSYETKFETCILDPATLTGVLNACREHKVTLTALLHGLTLLSVASQLDEKAARAFASLTAIDQRRFLPVHPPSYPWLDPRTTMANYVSNTTHEFDGNFVGRIRSGLHGKLHENLLTDDLLALVWSAASQVRHDIETRLQKGLKDDRLALMKFVTDARGLFEKEARKPRALSWAISNLGVMDGTCKTETDPVDEGKGHWSIERAQFTLSARKPDAALLIAAVSLRGAELVITCTWQDTVVEDAVGNRLAGDLSNWLAQIGGS